LECIFLCVYSTRFDIFVNMKQYANWEEYTASPDYTFDQLKVGPLNINFADGTSYERDEYGTQLWYKDGQRHREGDKPAVIWADGEQFWFKDGKKHRDGDLPAEIWADGTQFWYRNGQCHRDRDLPAVIYANGDQWWYKLGVGYTPEEMVDFLVN